jgi:glycosyltransferase involved in cell wall biosynthesis
MVALADKLNVKQNVIFTGRLSAPEVLEWLHAGDAFTLVSKVEGLPCSLIEAMAAGITPVVSNIPAHAQIIDHDQNGLLTDLGNEESIAQGYIRVLDDAALRARLGAAAREHMVKQFSTPRVADRYEDLFADCVGASR